MVGHRPYVLGERVEVRELVDIPKLPDTTAVPFVSNLHGVDGQPACELG